MQPILFHLAIIALFLVVIGEAGLSKILGKEVPTWFQDQFKNSWLGKLVPLPLLFWSIAIAECGIALLFLAALFTGEFLPSVSNSYSQWGCLASMFLFIGLCLGQRITYDFVGAANSFFYASFSGVLWHLLGKIS